MNYSLGDLFVSENLGNIMLNIVDNTKKVKTEHNYM